MRIETLSYTITMMFLSFSTVAEIVRSGPTWYARPCVRTAELPPEISLLV